MEGLYYVMKDFHDPTEESLAGYRTLSISAVGGLIFGLLSPLALLDPLLWSIPLIGVLLCVWALYQVRREDSVLAGGAAARWGLALSLIFVAAGPANWLVYWRRIDGEARKFAELWFDLLAKGQPEKAYQLTLSPETRQPLDEGLWEFYRRAPQWHYKLEQFAAPDEKDQPPRLVRTLLALGNKAQIRYQGTIDHYLETPIEGVIQLYAVTFEDAGVKKTFFAVIRLGRRIDTPAAASWQILDASGEKKPQPAESTDQTG
jgi:hypothetical protein